MAETVSAIGRLSSLESDRTNIEVTGEGLSVLLRIVRMALRYRWRVGLALASTVAAANFQLMIPQFLGDAVNHAHALLGSNADPAVARAALTHTALMLFGVAVLRGLFTLVHNYIGESVGHYVAYNLRMAFYAKLQQLGFGYHDHMHTGELITRGMLDIEGVRTFFNSAVIRLILLANLLGIGTWLLLSTDLVLGLLSLSFVPFVAWRSSAVKLQLRRLWLELQERLGVLSRIMDENLNGIRVVRAFAAQDHEMALFDVCSDQALDVARRRVSARVVNTTLMTFSYFTAMGLVLWVGGLKVIDGELTVGGLTEFLAFMTILQMPVRQLGMLVNSVARGSTCGIRLFEVLDTEPAVRDAPGAKPLDASDSTLNFEDVSFDYGAESERPTISGISFTARPGQAVGIVGPPGSGKSTIANLIPRFYEVTAGRITIGGQDIREVTLKSLRDAVGVIQQDAFVFTTSIENNIAYGDPWAVDEHIADANSQAQLHEYVARLPDGYGTLVGERGVSLSGGQRQRMTIARMVMLKPQIMVFDDSTASVDAATERRIRAALAEISRDRVTLIISHRLSSLMHANEILFIEGGRIIERGSHAELLALGGRYYDLYTLQIRPDEDVISDLVRAP